MFNVKISEPNPAAKEDNKEITKDEVEDPISKQKPKPTVSEPSSTSEVASKNKNLLAQPLPPLSICNLPYRGNGQTRSFASIRYETI